jgi:polysaccharide export outer membrane protein
MTLRMPRPVFFSLVALVCVLGASAAPQEAAPKTDAAKVDPAKVDPGKADYVLQPQDVLKVQVLGEDDLTREVRISQENTISLPLIGTLDLKNKSAHQAQELIRELYDRDYLVNPQVSLIVTEYAKRYVNVLGQVTTPGQVQFPQEQGLTLVEAIARAGGGTRLANLKKVVLKRAKPDGTTEAITINVEDLQKGESNETYPLQAGDVITVPERSI